MDGDHLDQLGVALQAHDELIPPPVQMRRQVPDQGLLAIERAGGLLQPFRQMQQVGQDALAVGAREQPGGQLLIVHQPAQHGQHPLALPEAAVVAKARELGLPGQFILLQAGERLQRHRQGVGRQRGAHQALVGGGGAGAQPVQQIVRLPGREDGVAVGEVDAVDPQRGQGRAHDGGFGAGAHQDGDVLRLQGREALRTLKASLAGTRLLEPARDLGGGRRGHARAIGLGVDHVRFALELPEGHGRGGGAVDDELLVAAPGRDLDIGDGIAGGGIGLKAEGAARLGLGVAEEAIAGVHHGPGGAEVGRKRGVTSGGRVARGQIGMDVGAAKAVDGLLGVADQDEGGPGIVVGDPIDGVEDAVLDGVGILELIDQRHRELTTQGGGQGLGRGCRLRR